MPGETKHGAEVAPDAQKEAPSQVWITISEVDGLKSDCSPSSEPRNTPAKLEAKADSSHKFYLFPPVNKAGPTDPSGRYARMENETDNESDDTLGMGH